MNPSLIYARAKGFGIEGPLAGRPSFDYVVQAATGMEMTQGGSAGPRPGNVVVNDYGTGLLLAAGVVCALLGRARGVAVTTVEASLAMTATLYQAGDVATLAVHGALGDLVGDEARGPSVGRRLYRAKDGWVTVCCVTEAQVVELGRGRRRAGAVTTQAVAAAFEVLTTAEVLARLREAGVPAAPSVHHSAVPDDPQVVARDLLLPLRASGGRPLRAGRHPAVPLGRRPGRPGSRAHPGSGAAEDGDDEAHEDRLRAGCRAAAGGGPGRCGRGRRPGLRLGGRDDQRSLPVVDAGGRALDHGWRWGPGWPSPSPATR